MAPPWAGTTYSYLSLFALVVELDHLPGNLRDEPYMHGIIVVLASTWLTS
jgi:hypothetical protein